MRTKCLMLQGVEFVPHFHNPVDANLYRYIGTWQSTQGNSMWYDTYIDANAQLYFWHGTLIATWNSGGSLANAVVTFAKHKQYPAYWRLLNHFNTWQWPQFVNEAQMVTIP